MNIVLFTVDGREELLKRLKQIRPQTNWIVFENGFLDNSEGVPVTDMSALDILVQHSGMSAALHVRG